MKYTFSQLVKNNSRGLTTFDLYLKAIIYPWAISLAWLLLNFTKVTANQLTLSGLVVGVLGAVCGFFLGLKFLVVCFFVAMIFDFADGTLARNGRGSGEIGIFLDVVTDRAVLCANAIALMAYHLLLAQHLEAFFLLLYVLAYLYGDVICYGLHIAKTRSGSELSQPSGEDVLSWASVFFKPVFWIPTRLSSPLLIIACGLGFKNLVLAYAAGLFVVLLEYVREGLRFRHQ